MILVEAQRFLQDMCKIAEHPSGKGYRSVGDRQIFHRNKSLKQQIISLVKKNNPKGEEFTTPEIYYLVLSGKLTAPRCPICGKKCSFDVVYTYEYRTACCMAHAKLIGNPQKHQFTSNFVTENLHKNTLPLEEVRQIIGIESKGSRHIPVLFRNNPEVVCAVFAHTPLITCSKNDLRAFQEKAYCISFGITQRAKCKMCDKEVHFVRWCEGYNTYCGRICRNKDGDLAKGWIAKNMEKYGQPHHPSQKNALLKSLKMMQIDGYKSRTQKARKTCMKKYGVPSHMQSPEFQELHKQRQLEATGFTHYLKDPVRAEQVKQLLVERYGTDVMGGNCPPVFHEKANMHYQGSHELHFIDFWLERYGSGTIKRGPRVPYLLNEKIHSYSIDFEIDSVNGKRLIEIKGSTKFFIIELHIGELAGKLHALYTESRNRKQNPPLFILNKDMFFEITPPKIELMVNLFQDRWINKVISTDEVRAHSIPNPFL